jgi:hypothetical protein
MTLLRKKDIHEEERFGSLEQGEMFCFDDYYNSKLYLKTETGVDEYGSSINAVCLTDGTTCHFSVDEFVIPVDCTIEITRKVVE